MEDLYVSLSNAARLLEERRALRRRIERWWSDMGWHIPQLCYSFDGVLVFGKAVATRRYEDVLFCHYAEELGLRPVWMEHTQGRLSTHSPFKRSLLHPTFFVRQGRNGGLVTAKKKLACLQEKRMQSIDAIQLDNGVSLVEYHHRMHALLGLGPESVIDVSGFYGQFGAASQYYLPYLSLFLAHAVLVDDFHGGEDASMVGDFTNQVFLPAYRELEQRFQVGPLIARMPWHEHLQYYPSPEIQNDWRSHRVVPSHLLSLRRDVQEGESQALQCLAA